MLDLKLLKKLNDIFSANFYYVGGTVRDSLLGLKVEDLDIATDLEPDCMLDIAAKNKITAIPTGLQHGTVTLVIDGKTLEVTTFRKDIENNGRHAKVEFTKNIKQDAERRDLTINAIYLDANNNYYDFYNGKTDLEKGRLKFIGDANTRIKEDYLRILRFCRFFADYDKKAISVKDIKTLNALSSNANNIALLSADRIGQEILKLCKSPNYAKSFALIYDVVELKEIFKIKPVKNKLYSKDYIAKLDCFTKLCLIYKNNLTDLLNLNLYNFSNKQKSFLKQLIKVENIILNDENIIKNSVLYSKEVVEFYILKYFLNEKIIYAEALDFLDILNEDLPSFAITGQDIISLGVEEGKKIGEILHQTKIYWINNNYPDYKKCLDFARKLT